MPSWIKFGDTRTRVGRGVFTERSFEPGEVVEICPVILIEEDLASIPEPIRRILFNWSEGCYALALGYGSIYNHADDPNLKFSRNHDEMTVTFIATRSIQTGDQLTISYNQAADGQEADRKDWFKANMIEKIEIPDDLDDEN